MQKVYKKSKNKEGVNIFEFLYFTFITFLPLVYSKSLIDPVLLPRQIYLSSFLIIILYFLYRKNKTGELVFSKSILKSNLFKVFLGVFLISLISVTYSISLSESLYTTSKYGIIFSLFVITTLLISNKKLRIIILAKAVLLSVFLTFIIVCSQLFILLKSNQDLNLSVKSITGSFANKNLLSSTLFLSIPFLFMLKFSGRFWKFFSIIIFTLLIPTILILQSKAVVLALVINLLVFSSLFYLFGKKKLKRNFLFITSLLIFLGISSFLIINNQDKFSMLTSSNTAYTRLDIWKNSIEMASKNLVLGVGSGNWKIHFPKFGLNHFKLPKVRNGITVYQRPHNDFLGILCENGIFGLIFYASIFLIILFYLAIIIKNRVGNFKTTYILMGSTLIGYILIALVDFPMERIGSQTFLSIIFSIITAKYFESKHNYTEKYISSIVLISLFSLITFSFMVSSSRAKAEFNTKKLYNYYKQNNFRKANEIGDNYKNTFYKIDPTSTPIDWYNGVMHFSKGDIKKAKSFFENSFKENPYNMHVINNLASCYVRLKNDEKAIQLYTSALDISPRFNEANLNLSAVYFNSGQVEKALDVISNYDPSMKNDKYMQFLPVIQNANIKLYKSKKGEEKKRIMSKVFNLDQKFIAEPEFIKDYGWSIRLKYKSSNFKVSVFYQFENSNWVTYVKDRDGKYNYLNIHGYNKFKNTSRNLPPGKYNIRLNFSNDYAESDYLTVSTVVPDYLNN